MCFEQYVAFPKGRDKPRLMPGLSGKHPSVRQGLSRGGRDFRSEAFGDLAYADAADGAIHVDNIAEQAGSLKIVVETEGDSLGQLVATGDVDVGGLGDETFDTGSGADVIIFNVGDGNDLVTGFDAALDCVQMASEFIEWVLPPEDLFARHITKLDDGSLLLTFTQESLSPKNTTFAEFRYAPIFT